MKPYYEQDGITIYHGDCREILPFVTGDVCITDPPYDVVTHTGARTCVPDQRLFSDDRGFESITADDLATVFGALRIKRWFVATMDWRHVAAWETDPPSGLRFVRFGVWTKRDYAPQFTGDRPATGWEAVGILHTHGGKMRWNGGGKSAVWHTKIEKNNAQQVGQKPLPLIRSFVSLFSEPGETILDPFTGSGTTLVAAKSEGRNAIGIEIEERYCEIAARRLDQGVLDLRA